MNHQSKSSILLKAESAQPLSEQGLALPALSCEIQQQKMVVVCGLHSTHLSPYMKLLAGIEATSSGTVTILDENISDLSFLQQQQLRQKIGFVLQGGPLLSVINGKQNLILAARYHQLGNEAVLDEKAQHLLAEMPETQDHLMLPAYMSRLLRRHLAIARPLMLDPQMLFIDNPFDGLGYHDSNIIALYMKNIVKNRGITLVVSSDDSYFTQQHADQIIFCSEQNVMVFDGWKRFSQSSHPAIQTFLDQYITANA